MNTTKENNSLAETYEKTPARVTCFKINHDHLNTQIHGEENKEGTCDIEGTCLHYTCA